MRGVSLSSGLFSAFLAVALNAPLANAQQVDPEWPCVQRYIHTISPAIMWPLPVEEELMQAWSQDDVVRPLAKHLGDLAAFTDTERSAIQAFADQTKDEDKEARLSLLAAGVVDVTNEIRQKYLSGIKRYTRQQISISQQIEDSLNKLSELGDKGDVQSLKERDTIRETLRWHERVYDQREQSIRLLCEQPVELEQRLSDVLREAAQYLP